MFDFHGHYTAEAWFASPAAPGKNLASIHPLLNDLPAQLAAIKQAGIDFRVLSSLVSMLTAPGQPLPYANKISIFASAAGARSEQKSDFYRALRQN